MSRKDYECGINNLDLDLPSQVEYNRKKNVAQDNSIQLLASQVNALLSQSPSGFLPKSYYGLTRGTNKYRFTLNSTYNIPDLEGEVGDAFEFISNIETSEYITAIGVLLPSGQVQMVVQGDYNIQTSTFEIVNMRTGEYITDYDMGIVLTSAPASYLGNWNAQDNQNKQITVLNDLESGEKNVVYASVDFSGDTKYNWVRIGGYTNGVDGKNIYTVTEENINEIITIAINGDSILACQNLTYYSYNMIVGDIYTVRSKSPLIMSFMGNIRGPQGSTGATGAKGDNGIDGKTPNIVNNYWYIDGVNTGVKALGTDGADGTNGQAFSMVNTLYSTDDNYGKVGNVGPYGETLTKLPTLPQSSITGKAYLVYDPLTTPLNPYYDLYYANNGNSTWTIIHPFTPIKGNDGQDGYTPYIVNGYWYVNENNTGVKATGERGPIGPQGPQGPQGPVGTVHTDTVLDETSNNPIANSTVAIKIGEMDEQIGQNQQELDKMVTLNTVQNITGSKTFEIGNTVTEIDGAGVDVASTDGDVRVNPYYIEMNYQNESGTIYQWDAKFLDDEYVKTINLLNVHDTVSTTTDGITYSVNNGVITFYGTATNDVYINFNVELNLSNSLQYKFNLFNNRSYSWGELQLNVWTDSTLSQYSMDENYSIVINNKSKLNTFGFTFMNGQSYNFNIKPMIVKGNISPATFSEYNGPIIHTKDLGEVIWENSSPNSELVSKSITLSKDIYQYRYVDVEFKPFWYSADQTTEVKRFSINNSTTSMILNSILVEENTFRGVGRALQITSNTSISIKHAYNSTGGATPYIENNACIVVKIIGIK